jgi:signal transduction histidine kinase
LERQLRKYFVSGPPDGEPFARFSAAVDEAYTQADEARTSVERSLELMSNELLERNEQLQADLLEIKRLGLELRQADKLRAVGQLAAGVAHEINTPIQFVSDSLSFLQDATNDLNGLSTQVRQLFTLVERGDDARPAVLELKRLEQEIEVDYLLREIPLALERSLDGIARVSQIVVALKDFGRPDQRERAFSDLNRGLENTLTVAQSEIRHIADVRLDLGELPAVPCYAGDINQVFLNLLINAAHAIEDRVQDTGERGLIRVRSWHDEPSVCIEIADNGRGIPEADWPRIFEPFFTTKPVGKGSGQGLAIARSIVTDKHGGSISFESEMGGGTRFLITLPVEAPNSQDPPRTAPPSGQNSAQR